MIFGRRIYNNRIYINKVKTMPSETGTKFLRTAKCNALRRHTRKSCCNLMASRACILIKRIKSNKVLPNQINMFYGGEPE